MIKGELVAENNRFELSTSGYLIGILAYPWIVNWIRGWGYVPYRGAGLALTLGLALLMGVGFIGTDYLLSHTGLDKTARSALWFGAALGPMVGFAVFNEWGNMALGQALALLTTVIAYGLEYKLETYLHRRR